MNLYLLRVGADTNFYSHINEDRSYIFIPIPDDEENLVEERAIKYQDYKWNNHPLPDYLLPRIRNRYVHNDPEFKTFTYGSPRFNRNGTTEKNYRTISEEIQRDDMLTFYAAFTQNGRDIEGYYFFAYFIMVDCAIKFRNPDELIKKTKFLVKQNHHYIHELENQVIVKGCPEQSRLLQRAVLLSSRENDRRNRGNYYPCQSLQKRLGGYCKSMNRSSIRRIDLPEEGILQFKRYLDCQST